MRWTSRWAIRVEKVLGLTVKKLKMCDFFCPFLIISVIVFQAWGFQGYKSVCVSQFFFVSTEYSHADVI